MLRPLLILLVILNVVVLLGQVWPEGAPSFAPTVNIVFLCASLLVFLVLLLRTRKKKA